MALDALESWQKTCLDCGRPSEELGRATQPLQILRAALAQPEREWQGLTDKEIGDIIEASQITLKNYCSEEKQTEFARAIEAKLKEKNS